MIGHTPKTREGRDEQKKHKLQMTFTTVLSCLTVSVVTFTQGPLKLHIADMEHKKR